MSSEFSIPEIPRVKVIKDGKEVDTSAIDDYDSMMNFIMLASIASQAIRIRRQLEGRISKGEIQVFDLEVTPESQEITPYEPCQSLYVENNGPGEVYVTVNSRNREPTPVPTTKSVYFPFENHAIERFFVWSAPGTVATARAITKY